MVQHDYDECSRWFVIQFSVVPVTVLFDHLLLDVVLGRTCHWSQSQDQLVISSFCGGCSYYRLPYGLGIHLGSSGKQNDWVQMRSHHLIPIALGLVPGEKVTLVNETYIHHTPVLDQV